MVHHLHQCWGGVTHKDDRGGAATKWPIPRKWWDWWANWSNLLKELVKEEGKGAAIMFEWVAVRTAYKLLRELALVRLGEQGWRTAGEDRRGKEKERRGESRGRGEAKAVAERERADRGARRNLGTAKEGKKKKSAFNGGLGVPVLGHLPPQGGGGQA